MSDDDIDPPTPTGLDDGDAPDWDGGPPVDISPVAPSGGLRGALAAVRNRSDATFLAASTGRKVGIAGAATSAPSAVKTAPATQLRIDPLTLAAQRHTLSPTTTTPPGSFAHDHVDPYDTQMVSMRPCELRIQQALQYRQLMRPVAAPLSESDLLHIHALIAAYLVANGFHRTANAFRTALGPAAAATVFNSIGRGSLDLGPLVHDAAGKASLLFDDDSAWPLERLALDDAPLMVVDAAVGVLGGTLDQILEHVVLDPSPPFEEPGRAEPNAANILFATSCCFVVPDVLFSRFAKMFKTVSASAAALGGETRRLRLQVRLLQLLTAWTRLCAIDFSMVLLERIASFAVAAAHHGGSHYEAGRLAAELLELVQRVVAAVSRSNGAAGDDACLADFDDALPGPCPHVGLWRGATGVVPQPLPVPSADAIHFMTDIPDEELARQLCLVHFANFAAIRPREFLNAAWTDPVLRTTTGNLNAFVAYFEAVQLWVASSIVAPQDVSIRARSYAKAIRVAHALYNMQNFSLAHAMLMGLEHRSVTRLLRAAGPSVFPLVAAEEESLDALRAATDPFQRQREKDLPAFLSTACIPHLATYIGEFCRVHETMKSVLPAPPLAAEASSPNRTTAANPNDNNNNNNSANDSSAANAALQQDPTKPGRELVNWSKMKIVGRLLLRIASYQAVPYRYYLVPSVAAFVRQLPGRRDEDALDALAAQRVGEISGTLGDRRGSQASLASFATIST